MQKMQVPCGGGGPDLTDPLRRNQSQPKNHVRQAGVLMHITSLPDGQLGPDAYRFVDQLVELGAMVWQTLPVNMPHGDQSPYQSVSAHAGHIGMISPQQLVEQGWCLPDELSLPLTVLLDKAMGRVQSGGALSKMDSEGLN